MPRRPDTYAQLSCVDGPVKFEDSRFISRESASGNRYRDFAKLIATSSASGFIPLLPGPQDKVCIELKFIIVGFLVHFELQSHRDTQRVDPH
jgi:hypothetical protein